MKLTRISAIIMSTAVLLTTMATAAPASAATAACPAPHTQWVSTYRPIDWATLLKYLTFQASVAQAAPVPQTQVKAPAPVAAAPAQTTAAAETTSGLTAEEQQMLTLVNGERAKAGLPALKADLQLTKLARLKSQDMINRNYFSHQSPTYGSPFDMMAKYGVTYRTAGENLAGNGSVSGAHTSLMNSSGHRANILGSQFNYVGIGIAKGGQYGMMFTQMFVGR